MTGPRPGHAPDRAGSPPVVALVGPTASGKSELALRVAEASRAQGRAHNAERLPPVELVSVDSMAVYRGMDIGTAKPSRQVRAHIPYHLVDLVDPWEEFTVQRFQGLARRALGGIASRGHGALLVGGTGLYLRSVIDDLTFPGRYPEVAAALAAKVDTAGPPGSEAERSALAELHRHLSLLDPMASRRIEPANRRRLLRALEVTIGSGHRFSSFGPGLERYPPTDVRLVGLRRDPTTQDQRITERFGLLMEQGFLQEVRALAGRPEGVSKTARQALGYRELLAHVEGGVPLAEAVAEAVRRTRAFSRRQWAWFRRDPRIVWLDPDDAPERAILALLGGIPRQGATVGD